jgi:predicted phosphate transport protein (TIGR00153 family)
MGLRDFLRPRQETFLQLIAQQAAKTLEGMEALEEYMRNNTPEAAKKVIQAEKEADELRRILVDELNRTFVTPIDREDIFALSRAIDDILDYGDSTVEEMDILDISPNRHLSRMASLLRDAANEIHLATQRLEDHPGVAYEHAMRAKALENRMETVYREALADLFEGPATCEHIINMLKLRELYRHLSNSADRGDEAANVITDIVVKMT